MMAPNPFTVRDSNDIKRVELEPSVPEAINPSEYTEHVKEVFKIEKGDNGNPKKILPTEAVIIFFEKLLYQTKIQIRHLRCSNLDDLSELLRALRNCASDTTTQTFIVLKTEIVAIATEIFKIVVDFDSEHFCLKMLLQFLVNLVSSNKPASEEVHKVFGDNLLMCLSYKVYIYETSALIYNLSLSTQIDESGIILRLLSFYNSEEANEFMKFYLENVIVRKDFWKTYGLLTLQQRILCLTLLKDLHYRHNTHTLHESGVKVLIDIFLNSSNIFFNTDDNTNDLQAHEAALTLEILSSLSSDEKQLQKLQSNKDVFVTAGILLINIHRLGKESKNCFTPVQKLSEFSVDSELQNHPAYGFKADLVRLIGNMCWKNKEIQDLARVAELIPIILESTSMDARNPFITQWCILAIRNLCDGNIENQRFIARMHQKGTVSSTTLEELGLTIHSDGENHLKVISLDALKNK